MNVEIITQKQKKGFIEYAKSIHNGIARLEHPFGVLLGMHEKCIGITEKVEEFNLDVIG